MPIVGSPAQAKQLISIIGLLNREYEGEYLYDGISISALKDRDLSILRANNIGFVFQNYSLIKHLRVWENIELPPTLCQKVVYRQTASRDNYRLAKKCRLRKQGK